MAWSRQNRFRASASSWDADLKVRMSLNVMAKLGRGSPYPALAAPCAHLVPASLQRVAI